MQPITISIGSVSRPASQPNPTFTVSYSGPASDYTQSVLSNITLATNAPISNTPGIYQINAVIPPALAGDLIVQPGTLTITGDILPAMLQTQAPPQPAPVATAPSLASSIAPANATGVFQIVIAPSQNWSNISTPGQSTGNALSVASFSESAPDGSNSDHQKTYAAGAHQ